MKKPALKSSSKARPIKARVTRLENRLGKVGRPPAGEAGTRVSDYPQVSVRLPLEARDKLLALSKLRQQPQWRLIVESVECYLRDLPSGERRKVEHYVRAHTPARRPRTNG